MNTNKFLRIVRCFNDALTIDGDRVLCDGDNVFLGDRCSPYYDKDTFNYTTIVNYCRRNFTLTECYDKRVIRFLWSLFFERFGIGTRESFFSGDSEFLSEIKVTVLLMNDGDKILQVVNSDDNLIAAWYLTSKRVWCVFDVNCFSNATLTEDWFETRVYKSGAYMYRKLYDTCCTYLGLVGKVDLKSQRTGCEMRWFYKDCSLHCTGFKDLIDSSGAEQDSRFVLIELYEHITKKCNIHALPAIDALVNKYYSIDFAYNNKSTLKFTKWLLDMSRNEAMFDVIYPELLNMLTPIEQKVTDK